MAAHSLLGRKRWLAPTCTMNTFDRVLRQRVSKHVQKRKSQSKSSSHSRSGEYERRPQNIGERRAMVTPRYAYLPDHGNRTKAADATEAQAAPDCPTPTRQRSRRGDLRCNPPYSQGLGCHLWPGRRDGRAAKARPPCRTRTPAPRPGNRYSLASRCQREG